MATFTTLETDGDLMLLHVMLPNGARRRLALALAAALLLTSGTAVARPAKPRGWVPAGPGVQGVTDETIEVGIHTFDSAASSAAFVLLSGTDAGSASSNWSAGAQAVVDYINANGGIAGRTLVPRYHEFNVANLVHSNGRSLEAQRACEAWTQTHRVFAMAGAPGGDNLECALRTRTMMIGDSYATTADVVMSRSMMDTYRDVYFMPNTMADERREENLVEAMWDMGFFTPGAKVGVLLHDERGAREGVAGGMLPALARHGITPVIQVAYPDAIESNWHQHVLDLQLAGVTHVLFSADAIQYWAQVFAMKAAENLLYYPRWAVASDNFPAILSTLGTPHTQLANTFGMGYLPDGENREDVMRADTPNLDLCMKIGEESGQLTAGDYCETLFFLKFVLDRAREVSLEGVAGVMDRLRDGYSSVRTTLGATSLNLDAADGPVYYRPFVFDDRCRSSGNVNCWKYIGPPAPLL